MSLDSAASRPPTESPQTSMTLSISCKVAQRMVTASKALNSCVARLQKIQAAAQKEEAPREKDDPLQDTVTDDKTTDSPEDETIPKRVVSASDSGSVSSSEEAPVPQCSSSSRVDDDPEKVRKVLLKAASECGDALIGDFLARMRASDTSQREIETCLLLFLDVDKSTKLLAGFNVLGEVSAAEASERDVETPEGTEPNDDTKKVAASDSKDSADEAQPLPLTHAGAAMLFKSFLTSISICIHYDPAAASTKRRSPTTEEEKPRKALKENSQSSPTSSSKSTDEDEADSKDVSILTCSSPSFDDAENSDDASDKTSASLPEQNLKEIQEIATFAADRLLEHTRKSNGGASMIPFEAFGDWYNSGGYSIVPWLELLDLAKWTYAGKADGSSKPSESTTKPNLSTIQEEAEPTPSKSARNEKLDERKKSPPNFFRSGGTEHQPILTPTGRVLVSFDFTGATGSGSKQVPFSISITEENLLMLRNLVYRTGLASRSPQDVCQVLLAYSNERIQEHGSVMVLHRDEFGKCVRDLVPPEASRRFTASEMETYSAYFVNFFSCFEDGSLGRDQVNVKELAVGFSFLCTGNKSSKLAAGFQLLNDDSSGVLRKQQLVQYLRSYLTMLAGISLLSGTQQGKTEAATALRGSRRQDMCSALDNGAKWTLNHFLKEFTKGTGTENVQVSFEDFAAWYTDGGFNIAPWLELLDLNKLLTLLGDSPPPEKHTVPSARPNRSLPCSISPKNRRRESPSLPPVEVLFTFPLANHQSLVVLREDATYVRSVVEKMGLVNMTPEDVWGALYDGIKFHPPRSSQKWNRSQERGGICKTMDVDQVTFVSGMEGVISTKPNGRKRLSSSSKVSSSTKETLVNFYHSFDLEQVDHVSLNQLMGGLSLLCGGKKSSKLAFAFGLFDSRNDDRAGKGNPENESHSLNGEELFLFLRSFLIVMFSCCRQSLDLSAEAVSRYISDTSHMVAKDVMRYQWNANKSDRVDFDEFGEWYNEGGFETAPWLELLDLQKWVLVDDVEAVESRGARSSARAPSMPQHQRDGFHASPHVFDACPPPPPDDSVDPASLFDEDAIMPLGSMDDMDYILMQQPSQDKENDGFNGNRAATPTTPRNNRVGGPSNSLKFQLMTNEEHGAYMLSISQRRVRHIRHILMESALCRIDAELACKKILSKGTRVRSKKKGKKKEDTDMLVLTKDDFDSAMRSVIAGGSTKPNMSPETQQTLSDILSGIFDSFDRNQDGMPSAMEVACGFTVLCSGKKSDKLEYAFDLIDKDKDGKLSRRDMTNYLRSFLTSLLSVATSSCLDMDENEDMIAFQNGDVCDRSASQTARAVDAGSSWAASQAFKSGFKGTSDQDMITFDDFAEWYTNTGFRSIPWLELLDLRKWVLMDS